MLDTAEHHWGHTLAGPAVGVLPLVVYGNLSVSHSMVLGGALGLINSYARHPDTMFELPSREKVHRLALHSVLGAVAGVAVASTANVLK